MAAAAVGIKLGVSGVCGVGSTAVAAIGKKILGLLLDNDERDVTNTKVMESKLDTISQSLELLKLKDIKAACVALKTAIACYNSRDIPEARRKLLFCEESAVSGYGTCTGMEHKFLATKVSIIAVTWRKVLVDSDTADQATENYHSLLDMIMVYLKQFMFEPEFSGHIKTFYQEYSIKNAMKKWLWSGTRYERLYQTHAFVRNLRELIFDNTLHILPDVNVTAQKDTCIPYHKIFPPESCEMCESIKPAANVKSPVIVQHHGKTRCYAHLTPKGVLYGLRYVTCGIIKTWSRKSDVTYHGQVRHQTTAVWIGKNAKDQPVFGKIRVTCHYIEKHPDSKRYTFAVPPSSLICENEDFELENMSSSLFSYGFDNVDKISGFPGEASLKLDNDYDDEPFHQSSGRMHFQVKLSLHTSRRDVLNHIQNAGTVNFEVLLQEGDGVNCKMEVMFYYRMKGNLLKLINVNDAGPDSTVLAERLNLLSVS